MWKVLSGVFLGWSLGANDSANIFGTGVATGVVRYRTAVLLTSVFVLIGAILEGPKCMNTVGELSQLIPMEAFCCTLAAGITMATATYFSIPASASQAIVGAILGAGVLSGTADFSKLYKIVLCWIVTPVSGIIFGYLFYRVISHILNKTVVGIIRRDMLYFTGIMAAGCYGAYSLGANNVANVTGVYVGSGILSAGNASLIGGLSIAIGVLTYSRKVMMTVGKGIVPLDPFSAFVVVLAGAFSLHLFTQIGVPVSSSQAVVGAVVGVGMVGNLRTVSPVMIAKIAGGWVLTPVLAGLANCIFIGFVFK